MEVQISHETAARIKELNGGMANAMIVTFYWDAQLDDKRTNGWIETKYDPTDGHEVRIKHTGEGRGEVYEDVPFVEIRAPGDTLQVIRRPVRPIDKLKFPQEWALFASKSTEPAVGYPLEKVPFLTKAQVLEFQSTGMRTAEHLADCSDANGMKFMQFQQVRQKVRDFLAAAKGNAPLEAMRKELDVRDGQIAAQAEQLSQLAKKLDELTKKK